MAKVLDRVICSLIEQKKWGSTLSGIGTPAAAAVGGAVTFQLLSTPVGALAALPFGALYLKDKASAYLMEKGWVGSVKTFIAVELAMDATLALITAAACVALFGTGVAPATVALAAGLIAGPALIETALNSLIALSKRLHSALRQDPKVAVLEKKLTEMAKRANTPYNDPNWKLCLELLDLLTEKPALKRNLDWRAGILFRDEESTHALLEDFKSVTI